MRGWLLARKMTLHNRFAGFEHSNHACAKATLPNDVHGFTSQKQPVPDYFFPSLRPCTTRHQQYEEPEVVAVGEGGVGVGVGVGGEGEGGLAAAVLRP